MTGVKKLQVKPVRNQKTKEYSQVKNLARKEPLMPELKPDKEKKMLKNGSKYMMNVSKPMKKELNRHGKKTLIRRKMGKYLPKRQNLNIQS